MAFQEFLIEYKWILLFYVLLVSFIYHHRKKFEFQAKFIALYKTKVGLKWMDKQAEKYRPWWVLFGYAGIGIGFIAMIAISYLMLDSLWKVITIPDAPPGISLIIPGVKIPGSPIFVPFWYGIIALFFVVVVHEASHGLVARAFKIPVKSTGIVFFGPLIGAFVEPEEKLLKKQDDIKQYSVFAAGPFSNIVLGVFIALLMNLLIFPLQGAIADPSGFSFNDIQEGYPAQAAGIEAGMVFNSVNGKEALTTDAFLYALQRIRPDETILLGGGNTTYEITTTVHPDDEERGYIGIVGITSHSELKHDTLLYTVLSNILTMISTLMKWIVILSLGIGLANLLPLGPVDGGRMLLLALQSFTTKKKADILWKKISAITLLVLLMNLLWPLFRWMINGFLGLF